jgi:hypothetical protein
MSLRRGFLKQQFGLFCWVHMSLLLIVVSGYGSRPLLDSILKGILQSLHRQQYPRGHDLVLGSRLVGYLQ